MTPEQNRAREHGREVERKLGLRIADCPECGDAIAKDGICIYCEYDTNTPITNEDNLK